MIFGKLTATAIALATVCSSAAGAIAPEAGADVQGLAAYGRASATASVHLAPLLGSKHFAMSRQLDTLEDLTRYASALTAVYPQCDSAGEGTLAPAKACVQCLVDGTCDGSTCAFGRASESHYFVCPVGECCARVIYGSDDSVNAVAVDGVVNQKGKLVRDGKCHPCVLSNLSCASIIVPAPDAAPGVEVECSGR